MRYFVRIAFIGSGFYGTQKQNDKITVQGVFEECLSNLFDEKISVKISSRLDRNVNALDFAFTFDSKTDKVDADYLKYYLARTFPSDILIKDVRIVDSSFSARYDCSYKQYCYLIQNGVKYNPLLRDITYIPKKELDVSKLKDALVLFEGEHDFKMFASPEGDEKTVLDIDSVSLVENRGIIAIRFTSKSFLRYQIRFMVGAMLSYERGKLTLDSIESLLSGKSMKFPRIKAEPQGLLLERIEYPSIEDDNPIELDFLLGKDK